MIESLARGLILLFAFAIGAACVASMYSPDRLIRFVRTEWEKRSTMPVAVVIRLVLGAALILAAPLSRFSDVFVVLGWIAIVAAVAIPLVGRERVGIVLKWFADSAPLFVRLWLLFGLGFCCFLMYALW
ncbi:MAG: hypothetical protein HKN13_10775 [Rhodothermales bacterium]|nr:hypothetical protein [Rhodothermales bacterium]